MDDLISREEAIKAVEKESQVYGSYGYMDKLKPCPFCGNPMNGYPDYTIRFKRDKRKVFGVYHEICILHCTKCTCTLEQAGATKGEAEKNVVNIWNRRVE